MQIDRTGCTRIVCLLWRWAVKLPNFTDGWRMFLKGLLANMQEAQFSRTKWPKLCPVVWSIPGGWIVIMRRAKVLTDDEFLQCVPDGWIEEPDYIIPAELKSNSFGWLNGKIVAIDYGS